MNLLKSIKNKLIQFFQCFRLYKRHYEENRPFQGMLYLDNSVISELRKNRKSNFISRLKKQMFIKNTIKKYNLKAHQFFITDKLFLEIIHKGKIRSLILKKNEKMLKEKKNALKNIVEKKVIVSEKEIKDYIDFLEHFFQHNFSKKFLKNN